MIDQIEHKPASCLARTRKTTPLDVVNNAYKTLFIFEEPIDAFYSNETRLKSNVGRFAVAPFTVPYTLFSGGYTGKYSTTAEEGIQPQKISNKRKALSGLLVLLCSPVLVPALILFILMALAFTTIMAAAAPIIFGTAAIVQGVQRLANG